MKHTNKITSACLIALMLTCAGCSLLQERAGAIEPQPEMKPLEIWVGEWTYEGEQLDPPVEGLPWGPGGKFAGGFESRFVLNGHFMKGNGTEDNPGGEGGHVSLSWYDPETKGYAVHSYLNDGTVCVEKASLDGLTYKSTWPVYGEDGTKVLVKGVWEFTEDKSTFVSTWHLSVDDGKTWKYYAEYTGKKVKK